MRAYQRIAALLVGVIVISIGIINLPSFFKPNSHKMLSFSRHTSENDDDLPCCSDDLNDFLKDIHKHSSRNILLETNITLQSSAPLEHVSVKSWKSLKIRNSKKSVKKKTGKRVKHKQVELKKLKTVRKSKRKKEEIKKEIRKEKKGKIKTEQKYDLIYLNNHNIKRLTPDKNEEKSDVDNNVKKSSVYRISHEQNFIKVDRDENDIPSENDILNRMKQVKSTETGYSGTSWEKRRSFETPYDLVHRRKQTQKRKKKGRVKKKKDPSKPTVLLAVGILSKLSAIDRRNGIRETWMKTCLQNQFKVVCKFFTDEIRADTKNRETYLEEKQKNNDLEYMPYRGGFNFALRLLWMFKFYTKHYNFDFFLRIDDDYFLCMDRLLNELPHRPSPIYWGWIHCEPGIVRVDEGLMILSYDIIDEVLERANTTLQCHPYGDQAVAHWLQKSELEIVYFMDNKRIIHQEVTSRMGDKYLIPDICQRFLGLHGTYPDYMRKYWAIVTNKDFKQKYGLEYKTLPITPFEELCYHDKTFSFQMFDDPFYAEPKPCKDNPVFVNTDEPFEGREHARNVNTNKPEPNRAFELRKMMFRYNDGYGSDDDSKNNEGNESHDRLKVTRTFHDVSNDEVNIVKKDLISRDRLKLDDEDIEETNSNYFSLFDDNDEY